MKDSKYILMLLMVSVFSFSSCTSEENSSSDEVLFSAKINGELFEATKMTQATLIQFPNLGQRFDITAENDKYKITFAISNKNIGECMPSGSYDNQINDTEVLIFIFFKVSGTNNFLSVHFSEEDSNGIALDIAAVTSCSDNMISGTFSGKFYYEDDPNNSLGYPENIEITEGKFQNIEFLLLNQ